MHTLALLVDLVMVADDPGAIFAVADFALPLSMLGCVFDLVNGFSGSKPLVLSRMVCIVVALEP